VLRGGGECDRRLLPVPRQQLVQPPGGVIGDAAQHIAEPGLRIDIVELGGGDQRVHRRRPLAAAIGACYLRGMNGQEILARLRENETALRARGVSHAALFGSRARGDNRPDSDIDIMVEFDPAGHVTSSITPD
jgi:Nucleotidyltransferase domain